MSMAASSSSSRNHTSTRCGGGKDGEAEVRAHTELGAVAGAAPPHRRGRSSG